MGAGALMAIGSGLSIGAQYMGYQNTVSGNRQQAQLAVMSSNLMAEQYRLQSLFQNAQASALMMQSGAFAKQADAYLMQADIVARTGEILQANEMYKASQAQKEADEQARRAAELRRQLVGEGRTKFAANGVLLESRPQAAVAMWEQDESADLAYELQGIKRMSDNEVWGYFTQGYERRMQSLFDAQALKLQADAANIESANARISAAGSSMNSRISLINAQSAILQGQSAVASANASNQAALWNFVGSVGGLGMNGASFAAGGGFSRGAGAGSAPATYYPGVTNSPARTSGSRSVLSE